MYYNNKKIARGSSMELDEIVFVILKFSLMSIFQNGEKR